MSNLYCKTKSGEIFKVWSNNASEETLSVYQKDEVFDPEVTVTDEIPYSDVDVLDKNLAAIIKA